MRSSSDDPSKLFVVQASGSLTYATAVNNNIDMATYVCRIHY